MSVVKLASVEDARSEKGLSENIFDAAVVTDLSDQQLRDRVIGFAGQMASLTARFLELLAEFDTRHAWGGEGIRNCAHWLSWRTGLTLRTAQEQVRVAHALTELPAIREAFAAGRLTYSKVRALTRVATAEREDELVNVALASTATQVERLVRAMRQIDRTAPNADNSTDAVDANGSDNADESEVADGASAPIEQAPIKQAPIKQAPAESTGSWRWRGDGSLSVSLTLSPLEGAKFLAGVVRAEYERTRTVADDDVPRNALESADLDLDEEAEVAGRVSWEHDQAQRDLWRNVPWNIAPAVVAMAQTLHTAVDIPETAPGAEVLVHTYTAGAPDIDLTTTDLATTDPTSKDLPGTEATGTVRHADPHIDDGPALDDTEASEAHCGATIREVRRNRKGARLSWGHKRRVPNAALVRLLTQRDRGCRHPGCGRTRFLHAHHVVEWQHGGATDADNLILLCSAHHRALHRGEFGIKALGGQQFTFHRPSGSTIEVAPTTGVPEGWSPNPDIEPDATAPIGGGRMDLGYTTEVLYAIWAMKSRAEKTPAAMAA